MKKKIINIIWPVFFFIGWKIEHGEWMPVKKSDEKTLKFLKGKYLEEGQKSKCDHSRNKNNFSNLVITLPYFSGRVGKS